MSMASTSRKNRNILAGLVSSPSVTDTPTLALEPESPSPPPSRLTTRMTALARVTSGDVREKTLRLVDPARCRMWERHNRRYDLLSEARCADLLESLRAQNAQEFPAIVRRVHGDPEHDYEVICGARRHWSVSYLRRVEHRDIKFLIEERDLDDEAAFRLSDVENRSRLDICDYERAQDYREAVETYYGGVAKRMAERLEVSQTWLSRFLDLAKLPKDVVSAFGDVLELKEYYARELKPLLASDPTRSKVMAAARRLAAEQVTRTRDGLARRDAKQVLAMLKAAAADGNSATRTSAVSTVRHGDIPLFTLRRKSAKTLVLELSLEADVAHDDFVEAFSRELAQARPR